MTEDERAGDNDQPVPEEDDTTGHSLPMAEYGRALARDRAREAEQAARESRMREDGRRSKKGRSFFRR